MEKNVFHSVFFNKLACPYFIPKGRSTERRPQEKGSWQIPHSWTDMLLSPSGEERPPGPLYKPQGAGEWVPVREWEGVHWANWGAPCPQGRELEREGEHHWGCFKPHLSPFYFGFYLDPPKQLIHSMLSGLCL